MQEFWSAQSQKLGAPMLEFYQPELDKAGISSYNHREVIIVMPYSDRRKGYEIDRKSAEKIYLASTTIRFRRDDKRFYDKLTAESEKLGITIAEYMRRATREKLGLTKD